MTYGSLICSTLLIGIFTKKSANYIKKQPRKSHFPHRQTDERKDRQSELFNNTKKNCRVRIKTKKQP